MSWNSNYKLIKNSIINIKNRKNFKIFFLFLILSITTSLHIWAINKSSDGREIIWEPDDKYHEIIKAKNLNSCQKKCLAINNLSFYDENNLNTDQKNLLEILIHHTAIEYHYVKSKILILLNNIFHDWESAQLALSKIVSILLVLLFAIFTYVYFGLNISLISSILALPYVTIVYGFHFSSSSSHLASVFAIISLIFLKKLKLKNYLMSLSFSSIAIFTHPIGIFMLIFNSLFLLFKKKFLIDRNLIKYLFAGFLVTSAYFFLDLNYIEKNIKFFNIYDTGYNLSNIFIENLKSNLYFVYDLFNLLNFLFVIIIILKLKNNYKSLLKKYPNFLPLLLSFISIIVISFFHYAPKASIIERMQILLTLTILSIYSILIYEFLVKIKNYKYHKIYAVIIIIIFCLHSFYNFKNLSLKIKSNQETLNLNFNVKSIQELKNLNDNLSYIIFKRGNSDLSVFKSIYYKFLIEGLNESNLIVSELLNRNFLKKILNENFYLILPSAIIDDNLINKKKRDNCFKVKFIKKCIERGWYGFNRANMSDLLVRNNDLIEIKSEKKMNKLLININTYGNEILIYNKSSQKDIIINTSNNFEWIEFNNSDFYISELKFTIPKNKFIKIQGIKKSLISQHYWPWHENINIYHTNKEQKRNFNFNIKKMMGDFYCSNYNIIDDKSSFILLKVNCK